MRAWQACSLEAVYPVVYLDAIDVVGHVSFVAHEAAHRMIVARFGSVGS